MSAVSFGIICVSISQVILTIWLISVGRRIALWADHVKDLDRNMRGNARIFHKRITTLEDRARLAAREGKR